MPVERFGPEIAPRASYPLQKLPAFDTCRCFHAEQPADPADIQFLKLLRAYRPHGGFRGLVNWSHAPRTTSRARRLRRDLGG